MLGGRTAVSECPLVDTEEHVLKAFVAGVVDPGQPSCFSPLRPYPRRPGREPLQRLYLPPQPNRTCSSSAAPLPGAPRPAACRFAAPTSAAVNIRRPTAPARVTALMRVRRGPAPKGATAQLELHPEVSTRPASCSNAEVKGQPQVNAVTSRPQHGPRPSCEHDWQGSHLWK